jgi:hypothetical protein
LTGDQSFARPLFTHSNSNTERMGTSIHTLRGFVPGVREGKDISCLRPRVHCDRLLRINYDNFKTIYILVIYRKPITVAVRSKARNVFARSNTGIVGSNSTKGMDVCVHIFCVRVVLCAGSGFVTG